ncbi:acyl-CoA dehydrogenase family protein [Bradyrhizobium paxllaeri]|uniref:acyl-CoA dehydrogenase family protein n=1 Tax=Bradyrhizobium paxllaeri TaxID=190148 RepID=UPI001AEE3F0F|nr:acyl-CoA dehydrogenase family protein [Bradyrhizobium paxllaeri]
MPHSLNDQHAMIRNSVRRFAESQIAPWSHQLWKEEVFFVRNKASRLGLAGLPYPACMAVAAANGCPSLSCSRSYRVSIAVANSPLMANFDAKVLKIVEGTSEMQRTIISRE